MQDDRELETVLSYYRLLHGAPEPQQKAKKPAKTHKPKTKEQQRCVASSFYRVASVK